ncbi:MAG: DMT family transporter [Alicyclobacillaceae bacterium]|nr:DMT family transporter [Alicyclobacillaceae bacterium]
MNAWGMTAAACAMAVYAFVLGAAGRPLRVWGLSAKAYGLIFLLAFVSTFLSFVMMLEGMKRVGAERASIVSMLGPVLTILLGTWVLGERLEPVQWAGCAVVLAAVTASEMRKIRGKG